MDLKLKIRDVLKEYYGEFNSFLEIEYENKYDKYSDKVNNIVNENKSLFNQRFRDSDFKKKNRIIK